MARRQTPIQKLVTFALSVTEEELNGALDTIKAIKDSRFPKTAKTARAKRSDAGKSRRTPAPSTPPAANVDAQSSSES